MPGGCELEVALKRQAGGCRDLGRIVLEVGERREVEWNLIGPGSIRGVCVDESGNALDHIHISRQSAGLLSAEGERDCPDCYTITDSTGVFQFDGLPLGEYWLHMGPPDSKQHVAPRPERLTAGTRDVEVRMLEAGTLRVTLIDAATGEAVEGRVYVSALDDDSFKGLDSYNEQLEYTAPRLRSGSYLVRAQTTDGRGAIVRDVRVRASEETAVALRLEPFAQLEVKYTGTVAVVQIDRLQADVSVARATCSPGESVCWALPAGLSKLVLRSYEAWAGISETGANQWEVVATEELVLVPGEVLELELHE